MSPQQTGKTLPMWRCTAVTVWCLRADGGQLLAASRATEGSNCRVELVLTRLPSCTLVALR
jgi:hypothetical protein